MSTAAAYLRDDGVEMVEFQPHMAVARPFGERFGLIARVIAPEPAPKPARGRRALAVGPVVTITIGAPVAPVFAAAPIFAEICDVPARRPGLDQGPNPASFGATGADVAAEGGIGPRIRSGTTGAGSGTEPAPVRGASAPAPVAPPAAGLGPRERRSVKALKAAGNSVGEIAWALDVPRAAVEAVLAETRRGAR